jgi:hypothetical protein
MTAADALLLGTARRDVDVVEAAVVVWPATVVVV